MGAPTCASGVAAPEAINVIRKSGSVERGNWNVLTGHALRKRGIVTPISSYLYGDMTGGRTKAAMGAPYWWRPRT